MKSAHQTTCSKRRRRLIDQLFVRGLSPRAWDRLRGHIAVCDVCRQRFDRLAAVELSLSGNEDLSLVARERIAQTLVVSTQRGARRAWVWSTAGVMVVTAAAVLLIVLTRSEPHDELRRRGAGAPDQLVPGERNPGLRLFCVTPTPQGGEVVAQSRATASGVPSDPLRCIISAELQLAYSTPSFARLGGVTMIVFARDESNQLLWYAPAAPDRTPVAVAENAVDEPLGWSTRLRVNHRPGRYRITARFFASGRNSPADAATAVMLPGIYELSAELEVIAQGSTP